MNGDRVCCYNTTRPYDGGFGDYGVDASKDRKERGYDTAERGWRREERALGSQRQTARSSVKGR